MTNMEKIKLCQEIVDQIQTESKQASRVPHPAQPRTLRHCRQPFGGRSLCASRRANFR